MFGRKKEFGGVKIHEGNADKRFYPKARYDNSFFAMGKAFSDESAGFSTQGDADNHGREMQYLEDRNSELQSLVDEARNAKIQYEKLIKYLKQEIEDKEKSAKNKKARKKAKKHLKEMRKVVKPGDTFMKLGVEWVVLVVRVDGNDVEVDTQSADGSRFIYWYEDLELLKSLTKRNDDPVTVTMNVTSFEIDAPSRGYDVE